MHVEFNFKPSLWQKIRILFGAHFKIRVLTSNGAVDISVLLPGEVPVSKFKFSK